MVNYVLRYAMIASIISILIISMTPVWFSSVSLSIGLFVFVIVALYRRSKNKALYARSRAHEELRKFGSGKMYAHERIGDEVVRLIIAYSEKLNSIDLASEKWNVWWSDIEWEFRSIAEAILNDGYRLEAASREYLIARQDASKMKHLLEIAFLHIEKVIEKTVRHAARARYWDAREMFDEASRLRGDRSEEVVKRYHLFIAINEKLNEAETIALALPPGTSGK